MMTIDNGVYIKYYIIWSLCDFVEGLGVRLQECTKVILTVPGG